MELGPRDLGLGTLDWDSEWVTAGALCRPAMLPRSAPFCNTRELLLGGLAFNTLITRVEAGSGGGEDGCC